MKWTGGAYLAWLGIQAWHGTGAGLVAVTGATGPRVAGHLEQVVYPSLGAVDIAFVGEMDPPYTGCHHHRHANQLQAEWADPVHGPARQQPYEIVGSWVFRLSGNSQLATRP